MNVVSVQSLTRECAIQGFDCGQEALNIYLKQYAQQDMKRNLSKTFVAYNEEDQIFGFYTLSSGSEPLDKLPPSYQKRLPRYPVPFCRLSRLAVDKGNQGKGLGSMLLMDAFARILKAAEVVGIHGVIVDAKDDSAKNFYMKFGFVSFPSQPLTLMLPLSTITKAFKERISVAA